MVQGVDRRRVASRMPWLDFASPASCSCLLVSMWLAPVRSSSLLACFENGCFGRLDIFSLSQLIGYTLCHCHFRLNYLQLRSFRFFLYSSYPFFYLRHSKSFGIQPKVKKAIAHPGARKCRDLGVVLCSVSITFANISISHKSNCRYIIWFTITITVKKTWLGRRISATQNISFINNFNQVHDYSTAGHISKFLHE
jgi:hypothetical protein